MRGADAAGFDGARTFTATGGSDHSPPPPAREEPGGSAHRCECDEHSTPAESYGDSRHAIACQHTAEIADAIDDTRGGSTRLLAAEVEREGAAEIGVRAKERERHEADGR